MDTQEEKISDFKLFTNLFEEVEFDTLHISKWVYWRNDSSEYGVPIGGSIVYKALDTNECLTPRSYHFEYYDFFALRKFDLSKDVYGLIIRWQDDNLSGNVELLLFRDAQKKPIFQVRVAELIGSEGYHKQMDSWFLDLNGDGTPDIVTRYYEELPVLTEEEVDGKIVQNRNIKYTDTLYAKVWVHDSFKDYELQDYQKSKSVFVLDQ